MPLNCCSRRLATSTLGQIKWEQMMFLGNPEYECDLQPIDFAGVAEAMGLKGYRAVLAEDCGYVLDQALGHSGAALVEVTVDPNEPLLPPKRIEKYAPGNARRAADPPFARRAALADSAAILRLQT
jgi:thiamine pyrophosphate-dependent acetolactate synthase large subunit-like protein